MRYPQIKDNVGECFAMRTDTAGIVQKGIDNSSGQHFPVQHHAWLLARLILLAVGLRQ